MRRRMLSLLLAFALLLGMMPMVVSADETSTETASVDIILSMSHDAAFMAGEGTGKIMALLPVTVPYFDLALYGLEDYYFSSEEYGSDGSGGPSSDLEPGTAEYAKDKVTLLHLYIYATEVFYCGEEPENAGQGYLYNEGLIGTETFSIEGGQGSSYLTQLWGGDCNLQYYVNHVYPLAATGWGATSDQILLEDGDIVTLGHFTSWDFYSDSTAIFNYITADSTTVTQGDEVELSVLRAGKDPEDSSSYNTVSLPVTYGPTLYYCNANDVPSADVAEWTSLGAADEEGKYTLDTTSLEPGEYIVALPGQYGQEYLDAICSTPGGMRLTVEAAETDDDQGSGSDQESTSGLNGDTDKNGTVDVTMTISQGVDDFYDSPGTSTRFLVRELNVPYFDLALYDLEEYYYNPECYTGSTQQAGTAATAKNVVTGMHAFIWATEVYVLGYDEADAGKGNGKTDMAQYISWTQGAGSSYMKFWNGSENLNYYLDYEFPLGRGGWGSTSDQQALSDGTAINIHLIQDSAVTGSQYSYFTTEDGTKDKGQVTAGTETTLTLYRTNSSFNGTGAGSIRANQAVYYIAADQYSGETVKNWTSLGNTDENGQITIPATLTAGKYYISCIGEVSGSSEITPAAFVLTVQKDIGNVILGDVNSDDEVNSLDAVLILRKIAGTLGQANFTETAADVNGADGITSLDAVLILRKAAGLISKFPAE